MRLNAERGWAALYILGLLGLLLYAAWQLAFRQPVLTDLLTQLPPDGAQSAIQVRARDTIRQSLNRQIIVLTGTADAARALAAAQKQAQQWSASALFEHVDLHVATDLDQLRQELRRMDQAGLPPQAREALAHDPQAWFGQRAQRIMSPLGEQTLIAADQDW